MQLKKIDRTVVLTLDKRLSQALDLQDSLKQRLDIDANLFIVGDGSLGVEFYNHIDINELPPIYTNSINYATWWKRPNAYNAWLSHQKILQQAKQDNVSHLFLLEDDAFLEDDFQEVLDSALDREPAYDMLYLGGYHRQGSWEYTNNGNLMRVHGSGGWHGVILRQTVIRKLLEFNPIGPYDWICGQYIHGFFACYAIYPSIISQRDGQFSYVEGHDLNKPSRYNR